MPQESPHQRRVAVITGAGGGIGTAVALDLSAKGVAIVALDAGLALDGTELGEKTAERTARLVREAGGEAIASDASVSDPEAMVELFDRAVATFGSVDIVVNAAGNVRSILLHETSEDDWHSLIDIHLNGYRNVLAAALPHMAGQSYGRIVGVTSGAGLARATPHPVYGAAKRAVAALTWKMAGLMPEGVVINCLSPIAMTRMITSNSRPRIDTGAANQLDMSALPPPHMMAPAASYLASEQAGWSNGNIVFSTGHELTVIEPPRIIEAIASDPHFSTAARTENAIALVLAPAEAEQQTGGGTKPRLDGDVTDQPAPGVATRCLVVGDDSPDTSAIAGELEKAGVTVAGIGGWQADQQPIPANFDAVLAALDAAADAEPLDQVVVVAPAVPTAAPGSSWPELIKASASVHPRVLGAAAWHRAAAQYSLRVGRPVRIVHVTPAGSADGEIVAQAVAQATRSAKVTPLDHEFLAFAVESHVTSDDGRAALARLVTQLLSTPQGHTLSGSELVVKDGFVALRRHPAPYVTVAFDGMTAPEWIGDAMASAVLGEA